MVPKPGNDGVVPLRVGLSGQRLYLRLTDRKPTADDALEEYKVMLTLCRPGFPLEPEYELDFDEGLDGDSHLAITKPCIIDPTAPDADVIVFGVELPNMGNLEFKAYPNGKGYLGRMVLEGLATGSLKEAEDVAHYVVARLAQLPVSLLGYSPQHLSNPHYRNRDR